jgi:hypothetical protein
MARTIAQIVAAMDAEQAATTGLSGLNSTSQTAIYKLFKYIVAVSQFLLESLIDQKKTEIENILKAGYFGTALWIRQKAFEFQYDATVPQVIEIINGVPTYPVIDTDMQIITRCSVKSTGFSAVNIKLAKSEPPTVLSSAELTAISAYYNAGGNAAGGEQGIGAVGINYNCLSYLPDRLYIEAEIFYNGIYASVIEDTIIEALETFMANMPFDGDLKVVDVVDALQGVAGFVDIQIEELAFRAQATAFGSRTQLIATATQANPSGATTAGYLIEEDTATYTFADKLTFTAV